ncbi:sugar-binding transcriptional regulator [Paenibacillus thalictri]|uniref:Sugar-binding transcriptional regulator n=1 Tax=Paenibacillus thalictri TaxID=2527873 RepID=A0A4Q9DZ18_9BACL|nr:sugar-binding transcriptional regulator [Paenibacillus thalictri]TBL81666.1 sugar-binding transcriptional regulator [Paenibacillus thalictri]
MLSLEEKKLIIKICKLYYFEAWTQEKIATKIGVSRPVISKLLQKARDEGVVEIIIHDDTINTSDLEQEIERAFQLDEVVVVPTRDMTDELMYSQVARAAAAYVLKNLKNVKRIGVSWGTTLFHLVKEFPYEDREDIKVIPLVGGMGTNRIEIHSNQIAYELSKKLNGKCESLYAPAIVETEDLKERMLELSNIASVLEEGYQSDLAIVGIGTPFASSTMEKIGYIDQDVINELRAGEAVGDINSRFIDKDGKLAEHPINNKVIGMELERLKSIKNVVGIAAGSHKTESVLATLKGGYLKVLITDEQTASELVNRINESAANEVTV